MSGSSTIGVGSEPDELPPHIEPSEPWPRSKLTPAQQDLAKKVLEARAFLKQTRATRKVRKNFSLPRETFDPTNKDHLESYRNFLMTGNWGKVRFHMELPLSTVTETVTQRFCLHQLETILGTPSDELKAAHEAWIHGEDAA